MALGTGYIICGPPRTILNQPHRIRNKGQEGNEEKEEEEEEEEKEEEKEEEEEEQKKKKKKKRNIRELSSNMVLFRSALKGFLYESSFYGIKEFFNYT
jgi:hypothetical protein